MSDNYTLYVVSYEIPESHGSHDFSFSEDTARGMYNRYSDPEHAESGQVTRLLKMNIRLLIDDALDDRLWMRTKPFEQTGIELLAENVRNSEPELDNTSAEYWRGQPIVKYLSKMTGQTKKSVRAELADVAVAGDTDADVVECYMDKWEVFDSSLVTVVVVL